MYRRPFGPSMESFNGGSHTGFVRGRFKLHSTTGGKYATPVPSINGHVVDAARTQYPMAAAAASRNAILERAVSARAVMLARSSAPPSIEGQPERQRSRRWFGPVVAEAGVDID